VLSAQARIRTAADLENLTSRTSAVVDKDGLAGANLPFAGLAAVDLLCDCRLREQKERKCEC